VENETFGRLDKNLGIALKDGATASLLTVRVSRTTISQDANCGLYVHVISRKKLKEAVLRQSELEPALDAWFRIAKKAQWQSLADVRKTFSSADLVEKWTVFNVKGNKYRLITEINYRFRRIYIRHALTHAQYDQEKWKR
jgi:mRNA interferase HigB